MPFIAWIGPMLLQMEFQKDQYVFMEGENVNYIYFILKGESAFVLPRFDNTIYILICEGDYFGVIDLIPYEEGQCGKKVKSKKKDAWDMTRKFTVQSVTKSTLMALKTEDLSKINSEFPDIYAELFVSAYNRFKMAIKLKKQVIDRIEEIKEEGF
jgi:CRP-like cAMP-binding protein